MYHDYEWHVHVGTVLEAIAPTNENYILC
jgi:hypothetical protein